MNAYSHATIKSEMLNLVRLQSSPVSVDVGFIPAYFVVCTTDLRKQQQSAFNASASLDFMALYKWFYLLTIYLLELNWNI